MNLKSACKTALILTCMSILLTVIGYPLAFGVLSRFRLGMIENTIVQILKPLLEPAGFLIFLIAITARFKNQSSNTKTLIIIAGIHVSLGTLISTTTNLAFVDDFSELFGSFQSLFYITIYALMFIASLCISIFIFLQTNRTVTIKSLIGIILGTNLLICALSVMNSIVYQPWRSRYIVYSIGFITLSVGYLALKTAIFLLMLAWLKQRRLPPEADVVDLSPEPLPTLSAAQELPGQE